MRKIYDSNVPFRSELAVFLLADMRNKDSRYQLYYHTLPTTLSHLPIFWTEEELGYLQGSSTVDSIRDSRQEIESQYQRLCKKVPEFKSFATLAEYQWARAIVSSRSVNVKTNGSATEDVLVPFMDLLLQQHVDSSNRTMQISFVYDASQQELRITGIEDIPRGYQLLTLFGSAHNRAHLTTHGFVVEQFDAKSKANPADVKQHY